MEQSGGARISHGVNPGWYVLTGGPCAGKTTLIEALAARGFRTVPEAARLFIEREQSRGRSLDEIRADEIAFQRALIPLKVAMQGDASRGAPVFFDRGMHDSAAYIARLTDERFPEVEDAVRNSAYDAVFLLDRLPYSTDGVRTETDAEAKRIQTFIENAYRAAGFSPIRVPVLPLQERIEFVLSNI